jgi:PAS domain S-box-containing protein
VRLQAVFFGIKTSIIEGVKPPTRSSGESDILAGSKEFLGLVLDTLSDPVFVKDEAHRWVYGNQAFSSLLGRPPEGYLGKSDFDLFPPEIAKVFWAKDDEVMASGAMNENEEKILAPDGQERWLLTKKIPLRLGEGGPKILVGVIRDITERKAAEKALDEQRSRAAGAARLASLGEMAGGVAHEINNPLAVIKGYAGLLQELGRVKPGLERVGEIAGKIDFTVDRIAKIVRSLRTIARSSEGEAFEEARVQQMLSDVLELSNERLRRSGIVLTVAPPAVETIWCRPVQISQVFRACRKTSAPTST